MVQLRFRQVKYFVEIVDAGSITRAATKLRLVPTALSLQVKKLEEEFGVALLTRNTRGTVPTPAGNDFYVAARRILGLLDETERSLSGLGNAVERYRFGMPPSLLHVLGLSTLLPEAEEAGGVSLDLIEGLASELVTRLKNGEIDFMLAWIGEQHPSLHQVEVAEEALVYVTAPDSSASDEPIEFAQAIESDLISMGSRSASWDAVRHKAALSGKDINAGRVVESLDLMRRMLHKGVGSAIIPVSFVAQEMLAGTVRVCPIKGEPLTRRLSFAWPKTATWVENNKGLLSYFDSLIADFCAQTAPHSRVLQGLQHSGSGLRTA